jgi:cyanate lyase
MGIQLKNRFEDVGREMGSSGRMKLAMLTKMSSVQAGSLEDTAANLKLVDDAIAQLRKGM